MIIIFPCCLTDMIFHTVFHHLDGHCSKVTPCVLSSFAFLDVWSAMVFLFEHNVAILFKSHGIKQWYFLGWKFCFKPRQFNQFLVFICWPFVVCGGWVFCFCVPTCFYQVTRVLCRFFVPNNFGSGPLSALESLGLCPVGLFSNPPRNKTTLWCTTHLENTMQLLNPPCLSAPGDDHKNIIIEVCFFQVIQNKTLKSNRCQMNENSKRKLVRCHCGHVAADTFCRSSKSNVC